jgi:hypothetical protein
MLKYINFEASRRYHAVYTTISGLIVTHCARIVDPEQIRHKADRPRAICACCRSRITNPALVPTALRRAKEAPEDFGGKKIA